MAKTNLTVKYKDYVTIDGNKHRLVQQVGDGSIIKRFDKTPPPHNSKDVICPHFLELKWGYGCPYRCAWCYLQGTLRFLPTKTNPKVKNYSKIKLHVERFFEETVSNGYVPELLNTGEIADSLMWENNGNPFSNFITQIFELQDKHKVLFLSKSNKVDNILKSGSNSIIPSFTLNAYKVSESWEKGPPSVKKRIAAAKSLYDTGYPIRIRIDPLVPIENWKDEYLKLIVDVFSQFKPERITLGSLRGLQSTINNAYDKSWVKYLSEYSNWGRRIDFRVRYSIYFTLINYLQEEYGYNMVALCKETKEMWEALSMDYRKIKCNCIV
jgi:spore photoproduct lyase